MPFDTYFGNLLTSEGLKPDPRKFEAILIFPDFCQIFLKYEPRRRLKDKGATWPWVSKHDHAFQEIRNLWRKLLF